MKPLTRNDFETLKDAELFLELAKRGFADVPPEVKKFLTQKTTCPHCDKRGEVQKDFGTRIMRGEVYPQSWCRDCRAQQAAKAAAKTAHGGKSVVRTALRLSLR